jgi:predicted metal-dependent phosphoesterase TrpH
MVVNPITTLPEAQNTIALKQAWQSITAESCPSAYNFHMHTVFSDGQLTPEALISQAVAIGLKGFAITDHHSTGGYQIAQEWLDDKRWQEPNKSFPHLWTGVEITSNLSGVEVHILGYAFAPTHPAIVPYLQGGSPSGENAKAVKVVDAIHQAGGLTVLAHPARYRRPASELITKAFAAGIDGVEAYYAYSNPKPWKTSYKETKEVKHLAEQYSLYTTCGTDTHGLSLLYRI